MQGKPSDLTGQVFGILTVIKREPNQSMNRYWYCQCECGNTTVARGSHLVCGNIKSCGCLQKITATRHGYAYTATHRAWRHMKNRCLNKNDKRYSEWGGRGITVCERWLTFENFLADMGEKPEGLSLDRINNELGYSPENCRWATSQQQSKNTRSTVLITYNGLTLCAKDWGEKLGINASTIRQRIKNGWSYQEALTTPIRTPTTYHLYKRKSLNQAEDSF